MLRNFGFARQLMMSFYKKETAYDAGVTMNGTNACLMKHFTSDVEAWPDPIVEDTDSVTGSDFATQQDNPRKAVSITYTEEKAKPNTLAGLAAYCAGNVTATQDGGFTAYRQRSQFTKGPITALPSLQYEGKFGALQYAYNGVKVDSLKITGNENGLIGLESKLIGSGTRASSATAFVATISESWMKTTQAKVWLESGAAISLNLNAAQGSQGISSGTPRDLKAFFRSFEWMFNNNLFQEYGYGSATLQDCDPQRRTCTFKMSVWFQNSLELDYFLNQTVTAVEIDAAGAIIATGGVYKYGMRLFIPKLQIKAAPTPKGRASEGLTQDIEFTVMDDGTNPVSILDVYTAKTGYMS